MDFSYNAESASISWCHHERCLMIMITIWYWDLILFIPWFQWLLNFVDLYIYMEYSWMISVHYKLMLSSVVTWSALRWTRNIIAWYSGKLIIWILCAHKPVLGTKFTSNAHMLRCTMYTMVMSMGNLTYSISITFILRHLKREAYRMKYIDNSLSFSYSKYIYTGCLTIHNIVLPWCYILRRYRFPHDLYLDARRELISSNIAGL